MTNEEKRIIRQRQTTLERRVREMESEENFANLERAHHRLEEVKYLSTVLGLYSGEEH